MLGLFSDVERVRGVNLHAVGQLEGLNASFELAVPSAAAGMLLVQGVEQVKLLPLIRHRDGFIFDVLDQLLDFLVLRIDVSALINSRKKCALPVL